MTILGFSPENVVIIEIIFILVNIICVVLMRKRKNYKKAAYSAFVAGLCVMVLLMTLNS